MRAYFYDGLPGDQRLPHNSGMPVSVDDLMNIGVYYYHLPELESVDNLAKERGYKNRDEITVSPQAMGDIYETKVKSFFAEHLHEDEEIRYIRGGRGYFDVRSKDDDWVRVLLEKDDLLILPPGIYHRFTTDESNYVHAMRLFKEDPKWTPLNRGPDVDKNEHRQEYVKQFLGEPNQAYLSYVRVANFLRVSASSPKTTTTNFNNGNLQLNCRYQDSAQTMDTRTEVSDVTEASSRPRIAQLPASCDPPQPNTPVKQLVWVIFGGTGQMGHSLVKCALSHGDLVTSVGRVFETSLKDMENIHENCLGALCDVRARESVNRVIERTLQRFGRIDIVVNCSGYGVIGACEDQDEHDIRNQFETNFMGTLHIIHATLPYFRRQNAGRYLIFSSTSGALGVPGLGPYCATKYAVEGLIEAMLYETDAFNIKATLIEPGHVRPEEPEMQDTSLPTSWGHFLVKPPSETYGHPTSPALHARRIVQWLGDKYRPTSAIKCAELVWQLGHCSYPPLRLLLGSYAIESIRDRMRSVTEELEDWKHLNFPAGPDDDREVGEETAAAAAAPETNEAAAP
ncbi:hypothetical protein DER46DRAFT_626028 [Fusarium sp. MPI-SDFR-AT-0072]|nr:hypothetical protein DER46DRAFT_626028 [Fusarium sp. MPI-SDFR-AT-0072]